MANKSTGSAKQPQRAQRKNLNRRLSAAGYTAADPVFDTAHKLLSGWSLTVAELVNAAEDLSVEPSKVA